MRGSLFSRAEGVTKESRRPCTRVGELEVPLILYHPGVREVLEQGPLAMEFLAPGRRTVFQGQAAYSYKI